MKKTKILLASFVVLVSTSTSFAASRALVRIYEDFKLVKITCAKFDGGCLDPVTVTPSEKEPDKIEEDDYHEYDKS